MCFSLYFAVGHGFDLLPSLNPFHLTRWQAKVVKSPMLLLAIKGRRWFGGVWQTHITTLKLNDIFYDREREKKQNVIKFHEKALRASEIKMVRVCSNMHVILWMRVRFIVKIALGYIFQFITLRIRTTAAHILYPIDRSSLKHLIIFN